MTFPNFLQTAGLTPEKCLVLLNSVYHQKITYICEGDSANPCPLMEESQVLTTLKAGQYMQEQRATYFDFCFILAKWYQKNILIYFSTENFC